MIVVTGGSGKLGKACIKDLLEHGYKVVNVDTTPPGGPHSPHFQPGGRHGLRPNNGRALDDRRAR